jgi:hypothetical protein
MSWSMQKSPTDFLRRVRGDSRADSLVFLIIPDGSFDCFERQAIVFGHSNWVGVDDIEVTDECPNRHSIGRYNSDVCGARAIRILFDITRLQSSSFVIPNTSRCHRNSGADDFILH